jgi:dTDP-glucose 4,6-dehydratase
VDKESDVNDTRTVLVTGGAGFIGGNFVHMLMQAGQWRVINLDLLTYAGHLPTIEALLEHPQHTFVRGDIGDRALVKQLLQRYQPQFIVNFAAESHVDRSIDGPGEFVRTNVVGTFNLLEEVRAHWRALSLPQREQLRFLHVSTDEVYGTLGESGYFTEDTPYAPNSPYAASKAASDHFVRAYLHTYGLPVLITNCSNNYGPYQFPEKLIPLMIFNALAGKPLPVYGDGKNVRDWLHVEDHCRGILDAMQRGRIGEKYNIGGHNERTNIEVVNTLCRVLDELQPESPHAPHAKLITYVQDRPGHDRRYAIDPAKIQKELGWRPRYDFDSGLRNTVEWYLSNRSWCERVTQANYDQARLGLAATPQAAEG